MQRTFIPQLNKNNVTFFDRKERCYARSYTGWFTDFAIERKSMLKPANPVIAGVNVTRPLRTITTSVVGAQAIQLNLIYLSLERAGFQLESGCSKVRKAGEGKTHFVTFKKKGGCYARRHGRVRCQKYIKQTM